MTHVNSLGGKTACQWQRRLRAECVKEGVEEKDVTHDSSYDCKHVLRSAAATFGQHVIGPGVVRVTFRLLENERDSNYSNTDSHGRHVFEFLRCDGSAIRLHYHSNGHTDEPVYVAATAAVLPGAPQVPPATGGAAQPTGLPHAVPGRITTPEDLRTAAVARSCVGREEAGAALRTLLHYHHGEEAPGAVDITSGSGFDWLRWLALIEGAPTVIRDGVHKVYAVRWQQDAAPEAVFCYDDGAWTALAPRVVRHKGASGSSRMVLHRHADWRTEPLLCAAPVASQSWLLLRNELF